MKEEEEKRRQNVVKNLAKEKTRRDKEVVGKSEVKSVMEDEETMAVFGTTKAQLETIFDTYCKKQKPTMSGKTQVPLDVQLNCMSKGMWKQFCVDFRITPTVISQEVVMSIYGNIIAGKP